MDEQRFRVERPFPNFGRASAGIFDGKWRIFQSLDLFVSIRLGDAQKVEVHSDFSLKNSPQ